MPKPTIHQIQSVVALDFGITKAELTGNSRRYRFAHPRALAVMLTKELTDRSYPQIGRAFGGRNHSTIIHAHHRAHELIERSIIDKDKVQAVRQLLNIQP